MIELLIWILTAYGIANGVVTSKLADPMRMKFLTATAFKNKDGVLEAKEKPTFLNKFMRKVGEMLICMMCFGFWVGAGLHFWYSPTTHIILDGFLASGMCWLIHGLNYHLMLKHGKH